MSQKLPNMLETAIAKIREMVDVNSERPLRKSGRWWM